MSDPRRREIYKFFRGHGFRPDRTATTDLRFVGTINVGTHPIEVAWRLPKSLDFTKLPRLYIVSDADGVLDDVVAHLIDNFFCYAQEGAQVLDRYNVQGTMQMCFERAQEALHDAVHRKNFVEDLAEEFVQHWRVESVLLADLQMAVSYIGRLTKQGENWVLRDSQARSGKPEGTPAWIERVDTRLTFPRGYRVPTNIQEFLNWAEVIGTGLRNKLLQKLVDGYPNAVPLLFLRAPNGIVGVHVDFPKRLKHLVRDAMTYKRTLIHHGHEIPVIRHAGQRSDPEYLYSRNTGKNAFAGKRIVLVGCGTIGSHLAKFLAQSGAGYRPGTLTLVDPDPLMPPNLGRHLLGTKYVFKNKASSLADAFSEYPNLNILAETRKVEDVWDKFTGYDLVIDATGEEAVSIALNHHFTTLRHSGVKAPAVLHVWLEGRGDAAQALLVKDTQFACYKCLCPVLNDHPRFSPLRSGYDPQMQPAACGDGAYMEYGVGAPAVAAGLAFTMTMDFLKGQPGHLLRTVQIDFKNTTHVANRNPSRSTKCPACGAFST